jgi:hypothetical protein
LGILEQAFDLESKHVVMSLPHSNSCSRL